MKKLSSLFLLILHFSLFISYAGNKDSARQQPLKRFLLGSRMTFIPNEGQITDMGGHLRPDVLYKGGGGGADVYLRKTGISYVYSNINEVNKKVNLEVKNLEMPGKLKGIGLYEKKEKLKDEESCKLHRVDMDFAGCNSNITTINE